MKTSVLKQHIRKSILLFVGWLLWASCSDFLDVKPDGKLAVPTKLKDLNALLNNNSIMNQNLPGETEESADNIYLSDDVFNAEEEYARNVYLWKEKYLFAENSRINAWYNTYQAVYSSNAVLEGLASIGLTNTNRDQFNQLKGWALFLRALRYYYAAQIWAPVYNESTAGTAIGLPIRTHTDFNTPTVRATVEDTYGLIVDDLKSAIFLLPASERISKTIPGRAAAFGLLARVYLSMQKYDEAGKYADSCIMLHPKLLEYDAIDPTPTYPFEQFNEEVVFEAGLRTTILTPNVAKVNPELYRLYDEEDLRKNLFFVKSDDGTFRFRGGYNSFVGFAGIASDEMYLIRAEYYARNGDIPEALSDINDLLRRCWPSDGTFQELRISDQSTLLDTIITERRKQLLFRGLRWTDLRRLNLEGAEITLTREVNGEMYTLPPNSLRYTLPIPDDIIQLTGIPQNP